LIEQLVSGDGLPQGQPLDNYRTNPPRRQPVEQKGEILLKPVGVSLLQAGNAVERNPFAIEPNLEIG
jgi:hypothetical protein